MTMQEFTPHEGERITKAQNKISEMIQMMNMSQVKLPRHVFAMVRDKERTRYGSEIKFEDNRKGNFISQDYGIGIIKKGVTMGEIFDRIFNKFPDTAILCDEGIAYSLGMKRLPRTQVTRIMLDTFGIVKFDLIQPQGVIHVYSASTSYKRK